MDQPLKGKKSMLRGRVSRPRNKETRRDKREEREGEAGGDLSTAEFINRQRESEQKSSHALARRSRPRGKISPSGSFREIMQFDRSTAVIKNESGDVWFRAGRVFPFSSSTITISILLQSWSASSLPLLLLCSRKLT